MILVASVKPDIKDVNSCNLNDIKTIFKYSLNLLGL